MKLGFQGEQLIKRYENCKLKAYTDSVGIWTIGYGNTVYENGKRVKEGDSISLNRANELFENIADMVVSDVNLVIKGTSLFQNQFDSLISFTWNEGIEHLKESTLLKKILLNPKDESIETEFLKWVYAGGKELKGLLNRRKSEWHLYHFGELYFYN